MREQPQDYWLVTLQRYAGETRHGSLQEWRLLSEEEAKEYAKTQMSTGAFVRITIEHVRHVECLYWRDFLRGG